jgi:acyl-CoA thioesterase-1
MRSGVARLVLVATVLGLLHVGCSDLSGGGGNGGSAGMGGTTQPPEGPVRVAFIGDSITEAVGTPESAVNYPEHLETLLGSDFELGNFGVGGATMRDIGAFSYWGLPEFADAKAFEPHLVTIQLGTNDTKPAIWDADAYEANYRSMIEEMQALSSEPTILLLRPTPVFGENQWNIRGDVLQDEVLPIIDELGAEYDLAVVDVHTPLLDHADLFPDTVHPTAEGGRLIALELVSPIVEAAEERGFQISTVGNPAVFPCSEQGIRDAITEGGGPHTFDCDGPTTVVTQEAVVVDKGVALDGQGDLTIARDGIRTGFIAEEQAQ